MTTVNIPGVEILHVGTFAASTGEVTFTKADLADMAAYSRDPSVDGAPIKLGHIDPRFTGPTVGQDGSPALGWVKNLRLSSDGTRLFGDLTDVPLQLSNLLTSAYPNRSIEAEWGSKAPDGTRRGAVLTALALLGEAPPAVKDLAGVYSVAAAADASTPGHRVAAITDTSGVPLRDTNDGDSAGAGTKPASDLEDQMGQTNRKVAAAAAGTDGTPDATGTGTADSTKTDATVTDGTATEDDGSGDDGQADATDGTAKAAAAAGKPDEGVKVVTLSQGQYDQLVAGAQAGAAALAQIDKSRRDGIITTALSEGRLAPADQETWRKQLDIDEPGVVALLATLPKGTVPVAPVGHADLSADTSKQIDDAVAAMLAG